MAKIILDGKEYDPAGIADATLLDTLDLKRQTGLGMARLQELLEDIQPPADATPEQVAKHLEQVLDSADHMLALYVMFWFARRRGGEPRITFEEACDIPFASIGFRSDPEPEDVAGQDTAADPTTSPASAPDAGNVEDDAVVTPV